MCKLYLKQFSYLYNQTLHNDCSHIEDVHLLFCAHLVNIISYFVGVELRHFFHPKCVEVSGLFVQSVSQFSFLYIQTLHNECSHIEDVHLLFCAHLINIFTFLRVLNQDIFFPSEMHRECLSLKPFSFLHVQTLNKDCSHIEDVHLLFYTHFMIFSLS